MVRRTNFSADELTKYRSALIKMRDILIENVNHLENGSLSKAPRDASGDLSSMPYHMADIASDSYDQEFNLSLMETEGQELQEIDAALERIEDGSFGVCNGCEKPIPKKRLNVIPYARFCVQCKKDMESPAAG